MAGHVATLTIAKSGRWRVAIAGLGGIGVTDGDVVPAGRNRVHMNTSGEPANLYGWRVSRRLLTFTKLKDSDRDREAVFWGVWKRK